MLGRYTLINVYIDLLEIEICYSPFFGCAVSLKDMWEFAMLESRGLLEAYYIALESIRFFPCHLSLERAVQTLNV